MDKENWPEIGRSKWIAYFCIGAVRKESSVADVNPGLSTKFCPERNRMEYRPREGLIEEIRLIEEIVSTGRMIICRAIKRRVGRVHRAGEGSITRINVLIELSVIGEHRRISRRESVSEVMVDERHELLHVSSRNVQTRATE